LDPWNLGAYGPWNLGSRGRPQDGRQRPYASSVGVFLCDIIGVDLSDLLAAKASGDESLEIAIGRMAPGKPWARVRRIILYK